MATKTLRVSNTSSNLGSGGFYSYVRSVVMWESGLPQQAPNEAWVKQFTLDPSQCFTGYPTTPVPTAVAPVTAYYAGTTAPAAGWTSSLGGNLDAAINELTPSDAEWMRSPDNNTPSPPHPWAPGNLLPGNWDLKFRSMKEAATGQTRIVLLDSGGAVLYTGPWHANSASYQTFTDNVTLTGTSTHFRIEDQP